MEANSSTKAVWGSAGLLAALMIVLFFPVLRVMANDWTREPSAQHGWFAVAFAGFLVWRQRNALLALEARPGIWGWILMGAALILLLVGYFGGDFLVMRLSFWLSIAGIVWAMLGWPFLRALWFPLFVLLWTIRVPLMIGTPLVVALQSVAELFTVTFLRQVAGLAVYRDGDSFEISGARLEGVELFSAMRLAIPVCFFAMAYAYLADRRPAWRLGFPILSLAALVAVVACFGAAILWVSDHNIQTGSSLQHLFAGRALAFVALAVAIGAHRLLVMRSAKKEKSS